MEKDRRAFNTSIDPSLIKRLKILAAETDRRINDLIEEAIADLLAKHGRQPKD